MQASVATFRNQQQKLLLIHYRLVFELIFSGVAQVTQEFIELLRKSDQPEL